MPCRTLLEFHVKLVNLGFDILWGELVILLELALILVLQLPQTHAQGLPQTQNEVDQLFTFHFLSLVLFADLYPVLSEIAFKKGEHPQGIVLSYVVVVELI